MKVAVALSGGVDSAVATRLLVEEGHEVRAYHMVLHDGDDIEKAVEVSKMLGVPLEILDLREDFKIKIVEYFLKEYRSGRTPNPCYFCNRDVKFGLLLDRVLKEGFERLATGHYARVKDGYLYRALDRRKDQSYFLSSLRRDQLLRAIFPLGYLEKSEVKEMARSLGVVGRDESQDVCFLAGRSLRDFLEENLGVMEGVFLDSRGNVLGKHRGFYGFTIGQRRGLGISSGRRLYVGEIRPDGNEVVLVEKDELMFDAMLVEDLNLLVDLPRVFNAQVKIRSNFDPVDCEVRIENDGAFVRFEKRVFAVTPGQIAVFYDGDLVLGSGVIREGIIARVEGSD